MREAPIQKKVKDNLTLQGWLVVKCIQMSLNGWPDLQAHKNGRTIFVECKRPGKEPDELQLYRHCQLRKVGFDVYIINDITTAKNFTP